MKNREANSFASQTINKEEYMDAKVFGQFLAQTRKEKNMTQAELAEKISVTDKAVSRWERGVSLR